MLPQAHNTLVVRIIESVFACFKLILQFQNAFDDCQSEVILHLQQSIKAVMSSTSTETDKSLELIKQGYNLLLNECLKDEVEDTDEVNSYTQLIIKLNLSLTVF